MLTKEHSTMKGHFLFIVGLVLMKHLMSALAKRAVNLVQFVSIEQN